MIFQIVSEDQAISEGKMWENLIEMEKRISHRETMALRNGIDKIKNYANMVIYSCFIFIVDPLDCGSLNKKVQDLGIAR